MCYLRFRDRGRCEIGEFTIGSVCRFNFLTPIASHMSSFLTYFKFNRFFVHLNLHRNHTYSCIDRERGQDVVPVAHRIAERITEIDRIRSRKTEIKMVGSGLEVRACLM